ncbi:hypothetical protein N8I74_11590 [Chitiniphilus purpureus]|uniref:Acyl-CoA dehydrogenase n=1 Tax=Chitiniphilus purpureus TaxID=2981137 RepID=A0ABY6DHY7_9NEIS|nr:hypothetical protein [Chitiniphilus sp. CD1]UXY13964.1 hypothetical protein N8I74_11590 [Chitiniphilus sp. CD1]
MAYPYELDYEERVQEERLHAIQTEWLSPENWESEDEAYEAVLPPYLARQLSTGGLHAG